MLVSIIIKLIINLIS